MTATRRKVSIKWQTWRSTALNELVQTSFDSVARRQEISRCACLPRKIFPEQIAGVANTNCRLFLMSLTNRSHLVLLLPDPASRNQKGVQKRKVGAFIKLASKAHGYWLSRTPHKIFCQRCAEFQWIGSNLHGCPVRLRRREATSHCNH